MTDLCKIAATWRTDKVGSYTTLYHTLLESKRQTVRKVLEIGIGSLEAMKHVPDYQVGASLFMWRDYFPAAHIFALDIRQDILINEDRVSSLECDQSSHSELLHAAEWCGGNLDLVIDDGDHVAEHQILTAITLMPFVKPDGLYIIEDTNDPELVSRGLPFEHAVIAYKYKPGLTGRCIVIRA